jgi:hypothetical protein
MAILVKVLARYSKIAGIYGCLFSLSHMVIYVTIGFDPSYPMLQSAPSVAVFRTEIASNNWPSASRQLSSRVLAATNSWSLVTGGWSWL